MSGTELDDAEDDMPSVDVQKHHKLVADVQALGNETKSKYKYQRGEAAPRLSEFGLPSKSGHLSLSELVTDSSQLGLKKAVKRIEKNKRQPSSVLEPVLLKPEEEKQTRVVAYSKIKDDLKKWDEIVWENRVAPNLSFPLEKPNFRVLSLKEYAEEFTPTTEMESEVMALVNEGQETISQFKVAKSRAEERQLRRRALEEIRERRAELIKQRMKVTYEARKAKHRNRIKSRRFHQVLRREKNAKQKKAEENATPEEAAAILSEKLADLERARIEERASLRHRTGGGGKFADKQRIMARFDPIARQAVENMVAVSKQLTEKRLEQEDDDQNESDEDSSNNEQDAAEPVPVPAKTDKLGAKNPWFFASKANTEKAASSKDQSHGKTATGPIYTKLSKISAAEENIRRDNAEFHPDAGDNSVIIIESSDKADKNTEKAIVNKPSKTIQEAIGATAPRVEPILNPSLIAEAPHNPNDQRLDVAAAFAEDDVVAEFVSEKEKLAKKEQPDDVNLSLPGWGGWAGPGISKAGENRRKKQFTLKAEKVVRRDADIPHVIIKEAPEKASDAIAKHQPTSIPFPFTSAREFERSLRQPVGREWVPEVSRRELIKPRIETRIGAIIEPLDTDGKVLKRKLEESERNMAERKVAKKKLSVRAKLKKNHGKKKNK